MGLSIGAKAQIINTEALRMVTDTTGWAGSVSLNVGLVKNVKELVQIRNRIHVQYKRKKHLFLFMNTLGFYRADGANFVNKGAQHVRYNYRFHPRLAWEAFIQNQYNSISKIAFRRLVGSGIRFKITTDEKHKTYLGSLIMYEKEKSTDEVALVTSTFRNSTYFSFSFFFKNGISWVSTTYYQPDLTFFKDYRIAHQSSFKARIYKNLSYKTDFLFTYDVFPVAGIPKMQYALTNGLVWKFQ